MINEAMIFAAGLGKRMRPLSLNRPKPLIKINNGTLLSNNINKLVKSKIKNIIVNAYHHPQKIIEETKNYSKQVRVLVEKERLETGGGFLNAIKNKCFFTDNPILLVNGDIFWINKYYNSINFIRDLWNPKKMDILICLKKREEFFGYRGTGDFDCPNPTDTLLKLQSKKESPYVFTGLQIIKQEIVVKKRKKKFSIREQIIESARKKRLFGYVDKNSWFHIGTVKDYEQFRDNFL